MLNRFLLATDLSPASFAVVQAVGGLREFGARDCLLLQCLSAQEATAVALSPTSLDTLDDRLAEQQRLLEGQGFSVTTGLVAGFARAEIHRIADQEQYPLIVVGALGHANLLGETLFGGVAHELLQHAARPVLLLRLDPSHGHPACGATAAFKEHILFPTDFSENADQAFQYLEDLAAAGIQRVTLLHVQDRARLEPDSRERLETFNAIDQSRLDALRARLERRGVARVTCEVTHGAPVTEILRAIRERDARLVLMGSQGRGFIEEIVLGSVSHQVARHAPTAVWLVPARRPGGSS